EEATDLGRAVKLGAFFLEAANTNHLAQKHQRVFALERGIGRIRLSSRGRAARAGLRRLTDLAVHDDAVSGDAAGSVSRVERSPSGNPSSRALSRRRMILPLRVFGTLGRKSISLGATTAPRRLRAKPSRSRRSSSLGA